MARRAPDAASSSTRDAAANYTPDAAANSTRDAAAKPTRGPAAQRSGDAGAKRTRGPAARGADREGARGEGGASRASVRTLSGVGPRRAEALERAGFATLRDLALCLPRGASAFPAATPIAKLWEGEPGPDTAVARILGRVSKKRFARFGRRSLLTLCVEQDGAVVDVLFFNQSWLRERFAIGESIEVLGRRVEARGRALTCLALGTKEKPLPVAGSLVVERTAPPGISPEFLARLCREALERARGDLADPLPPEALAEHGLVALARAAEDLLAPRTLDDFEAARRRVALERTLGLQARIAARRAERRTGRAPRILPSDADLRALLAGFPFPLTAGQLAVASDLRDDLARTTPMRRLLQGDVGSGKTVLGILASLFAVRAGLQAAFLAPTELLAEQHFLGLRGLCEAAGHGVELLVGSRPPGERRALERRLAQGEPILVFGTHALLSESVRFARLAVAVIDEQHRFGVEQRQRLAGKGTDVHLLLMTATPIPRTLALSIYGDLDVSLLFERPPGRVPVETIWVRPERKREAKERIVRALEAGERVFWVVPRIGEDVAPVAPELARLAPVSPTSPTSSTSPASPTSIASRSSKEEASAVARFERLSRSELARHGVELVHGRLPAEERARRLARFRAGDARLLVATTVIEVGVDVPEATVIVIECAERLGLAQLHQLRGRVGRGARGGLCLLYGKPAARERFELLEREHDGFRIAEHDLRLRGMGELAGVRQAGASDLAASGPEELERNLLLARRLFDSNPALAAAYAAASPAFDS